MLTRDDSAVVLPGHGPDHDDRPGAGVQPVPAGPADAARRGRPGDGGLVDRRGLPREPSPHPRACPSTRRRTRPGSTHVRDTLAGAPPTAPATASSSCRSSRTPGSTRAASASPPTSSSKEMYTFADRGDRSVTLRPEGTAGVVRAVIEHGLDRAGPARQAALRGPVLPLRASAGRALPAAAAGRDRGDRRRRPGAGRRGHRRRRRGLQGAGPHRLPAGAHVARRRRVPARLPRAAAGVPGRAAARRGHPGRAPRINPLRVLDDKRPEVRALLGDAPLLVDHLSAAAAEHHAAGAGPPRRPRRGLRREPADGARPGLLHEDDVRVRARRARRAVGDRRRRPLRRVDGHARRAAALRRRLRARRRPHAAGLPGRGARAVVGGALRGVRGAAGRGRPAPAGGARRGAAPGRRAGRPGLRRPGAEGRDEGGRPLRCPLRPGARRTRPRGRHGRGQGHGVGGAAGGAARRRRRRAGRAVA